jgi:hypothetical protein
MLCLSGGMTAHTTRQSASPARKESQATSNSSCCCSSIVSIGLPSLSWCALGPSYDLATGMVPVKAEEALTAKHFDGRIMMPPKECPNECSGRGLCIQENEDAYPECMCLYGAAVRSQQCRLVPHEPPCMVSGVNGICILCCVRSMDERRAPQASESYLACRKGHFVPIWQPLTGSSIQ